MFQSFHHLNFRLLFSDQYPFLVIFPVYTPSHSNLLFRYPICSSSSLLHNIILVNLYSWSLSIFRTGSKVIIFRYPICFLIKAITQHYSSQFILMVPLFSEQDQRLKKNFSPSQIRLLFLINIFFDYFLPSIPFLDLKSYFSILLLLIRPTTESYLD